MMKRIMIVAVCFSFLSIQEAYAVFDIMAAIQSKLELYKDVENKVQEMQKKISDIRKRATQGFEIASNCFKNPTKCDLNAITTFTKDSKSFVQNNIKEIRVMPNSIESQELVETKDEELTNAVDESYIYTRRKGEDIERTNKNRKDINAVIIDDVAIAFAKGVATKQSIYQETGDLYQYDFKNKNIDEILHAQNIVTLATQQRLNRILELKAYQISAQETADLTRQSHDDTSDLGNEGD